MESENQQFLLESTESIELELTAKGTYKFTIKIRSKELSVKDLERLDKINNYLVAKYGDKNGRTN